MSKEYNQLNQSTLLIARTMLRTHRGVVNARFRPTAVSKS